MKNLSPSDRTWRTIEELDLAEAWGAELMAWLATLPLLRRVTRLYAGDLTAVTGPLPWTHLQPRSGHNVAAAIRWFPALEELDLSLLPRADGQAIVATLHRPQLRVILGK